MKQIHEIIAALLQPVETQIKIVPVETAWRKFPDIEPPAGPDDMYVVFTGEDPRYRTFYFARYVTLDTGRNAFGVWRKGGSDGIIEDKVLYWMKLPLVFSVDGITAAVTTDAR
jgi:hypothetical protein